MRRVVSDVPPSRFKFEGGVNAFFFCCWGLLTDSLWAIITEMQSSLISQCSTTFRYSLYFNLIVDGGSKRSARKILQSPIARHKLSPARYTLTPSSRRWFCFQKMHETSCWYGVLFLIWIPRTPCPSFCMLLYVVFSWKTHGSGHSSDLTVDTVALLHFLSS